jgi:O-antigen/teichoic acid export membrane protein
MLSNIINYAGMFVIAVMITRILGIDALGEFTMIFAVSSILSSINEFGFSTLLVRKINNDRGNIFSLLKIVNTFKFVFGLVIIIVTAIIVYVTMSNALSFALIAGLLMVIPKSIQASYESSLRALMKQIFSSALKSINTLIQIILAYLMLVNSFDLFSLMAMILTTEIITTFIYKYQNRAVWIKILKNEHSSISYNFNNIVGLLKESWLFLANNFLTLSMPRINILIIGYMISQAAVGIFSASSRIISSIGLLSGALFNTYYPALISLKDKPKEQFRFTSTILTYSFFVGLLIIVFIYFLSGIVIDLTFKIDEAKIILKILSFTILPILLSSILKAFFYAYFKENYLFILFIVWWIFNIVIGLFFIALGGLHGFAYSSLITEFLFFFILFSKFYREKIKLDQAIA